MYSQQSNDHSGNKEEEMPKDSNRVPFFIRAISGLPDDVTFDEFYSTPTGTYEPNNTKPDTPTTEIYTPETSKSETSKSERCIFSWNTEHIDKRSYYIELVGNSVFPMYDRVCGASFDKVPKICDQDSVKKDEDEKAEYYWTSLYKPHRLPELDCAQVNTLSKHILSNIALFDGMRTILKEKLALNELQQWEYDDFKEMFMSLAKSVKLTTEEKKSWQRHVVTDTLLWMTAIDYRYKFDLAQTYLDMIEVDQLSLIWISDFHITHFVVYPRVDNLWSEFDKGYAEEKKAEEKKAEEKKAEEKKAEEKKAEEKKAEEKKAKDKEVGETIEKK